MKVSSGDWVPSATIPVEQMSPVKPSIITNGNTTINGASFNGYNSSTKRKKTGSYIETFTNKEIKANTSLIINPETFDRTNTPDDGIGAFRITAIDGKVYHYSLPVYQKELFTKSTDATSDFNNRFYEKQQLVPYATHWLLTAITGPDYVDTNSNNLVDQGDYGYWTSFDYGKWSDGFVWNTPVKSNEKIKSYEWGVKEIYYLDKIKTRTHTAIFVKEERQDDLSYTLQVGNTESDLEWKEKTSRSFVKDKNGYWYFAGIYNNSIPVANVNPAYSILEGSYGQFIKFNSHKSLKLNKILLFKNEDLNISKNTGQYPASAFKGQIKFSQHFIEWNISGSKLKDITVEPHNRTWYGEFYNNVLDIKDVSSSIEQKAIKTINFNYSNNLAKNSPNSSTSLKGKLTLENVEFLGKMGSKILPPYKFTYINDLNYDSTKEDNWGFYKDRPEMWSLSKIKTPTGAEIEIKYESDDIDKEAITGSRGFDGALQFSFSNYNNMLRIKVENEAGSSSNINFQNFFQEGTQTSLDLWTSLKHDYDDFGCKARKGSIDVNSNVNVISVSSSTLILETSMSSCYNDNDGLNWLFARTVGINNHPGMIIENFKRGEWGEPPGCDSTDRLVLLYSLQGNIKTPSPIDKNGGGVRVKELNIIENNIVKNSSKYYYNMPGFAENKTDLNYKSSGITSFIPQKYFKEIKYIAELPSPGVMYEYVTVKNYSENNTLGITEQYNFNVLKQDTSLSEEDLIIPDILEIRKTQSIGGSNNINYNRYKINDLTSSLGRLKQKKIFNNSLQLLSDIQYSYKNSANIFQGISEESFNTYKKINNDGTIIHRLGVTSKTKYPNLLESIITKQGGLVNTSFFDTYDFLTGQVTETRSISSTGEIFKSKIIPAYKKYQNMGAKSENSDYRNMLSQEAVNYSYIFDKNDTNKPWKETGVGITTWSNLWTYKDIAGNINTPTAEKEKIWRKHKSYVWNGKNVNGIFTSYDSSSGSGDDLFDWAIGAGQPSQWKQLSEITLYDHFSTSLETKNVNGNYSSTKMGDNESKVILAGNAAYSEIFFSGAENIIGVETTSSLATNWLEPEIKMINAKRNTAYFHTGKRSIEATNSSSFGVLFNGTPINGLPAHRTGKYKISVWVEKTNASKARINNNGTIENFKESYTAGNWVLKTSYVDVPSGSSYIYVTSIDATTVYFDDLMIRPVSTSIMGYVYNEWDELSYIIGKNGLATKFEYDPAGRLIKTSTEVLDDSTNGVTGGFKVVKTNMYNNRYLN